MHVQHAVGLSGTSLKNAELLARDCQYWRKLVHLVSFAHRERIPHSSQEPEEEEEEEEIGHLLRRNAQFLRHYGWNL